MAFAATAEQREMWHLDRVLGAGAALNIPVAWRLRGPLDEQALQAALRLVITSDEGLRASFSEHDGELLARIMPVPGNCLDVEDLADPAGANQRLASFAAEPFDLAAGPLLRALLLRLPDGDRLLALLFHHIAVDAWSLDQIGADLGQAYLTALENRPESALEPPVSLEGTVQRVNAWRQEPAWGQELDYWADQLRGVTGRANLPGETGGARLAGYAAQVHEHRLAAATAQRLTPLARTLGMTRFPLLFAAYAGTIARWANQDDFVLAVPVSNRGGAGAQAQSLLAVDLLPIRVRLTGDPTFAEIAGEIRRLLIEAMKHGSPTLSEIQRRCQAETGHQIDGLSDLVVTYQVHQGEGLDLGGVDCHQVPVSTTTSLYRLAGHIDQHADDDLRIELRSRVLGAAELASLADRLAAVADAVTRNPELALSEWPVLLPGEPTVITGGPAPAAPPESVPQLFLDASVEFAETTAVESAAGRLTYWQLRRWVLGLAARIEAAPAVRGEPVAVCVRRDSAMVASMHAVFAAGRVYLPLDPAWPPGRMSLILSDAGVRCVICDESTASLPALSGVTKIMADPAAGAAGGGSLPPPDLPAAADPAYLIYTSGSSGAPKGVLVEHGTLGWLIASMRDLLSAAAVERVLASTATVFDISLVELLLPVALGATCVVADDEAVRDPMLLAGFIASRRVDLVQATPTVWSALLEHLEVQIPVAIAAGEPLPGGLRDRMLAVADLALNGYGPTEATIYATMWPLEAGVPVAIGTPLPGASTWVLDRWDRPCVPGTTGQLLIGGAGVARGYLERAGTLTRERFINGLATVTEERAYRSGDLASCSASGTLFVHGRQDGQVKVRGNRVELGEIEAILQAVDGVAAAAATVFGRGDHNRGLAAFVQPQRGIADGLPADLEQRIRAALADQLPSAMRPQLILPVSALPLTSSGKTDRAELARRAQAVPSPAAEPAAPADELLATVTATFAEVLGLPAVGPGADFFGLGGDSMAAARVVAKMRRRFGVPLSLQTFLDGPTASDLSGTIRSGLARSASGS